MRANSGFSLLQPQLKDQSSQTDLSIWDTLADEGFDLPPDLRNILSLMRFDNKVVLSSFSGDSALSNFEKIEKFMQSKAHLLLEPSDIELCYGIFLRQPKLFELVEGKALKIYSFF